jgi:hypothetical protein
MAQYVPAAPLLVGKMMFSSMVALWLAIPRTRSITIWTAFSF